MYKETPDFRPGPCSLVNYVVSFTVPTPRQHGQVTNTTPLHTITSLNNSSVRFRAFVAGELPRELKEELTENIKFRINETAHRLTDLPSEPKWKGNVFSSTLRLDLRGLVFGDGEPSDYHVWKQFPFDAPDVNLRIEMTSLTVKDFKTFKARP